MTHAPSAPAASPDAAAASGCCNGKAAADCCKTANAPAPAAVSIDEIEALPTVALVQRYRRGIEGFDRRVFSLSERQIDMAFLPEAGVGRWPVRVLVGHVADADLAWVHRMRRAIGEENPVIAVWDEDAFVDANIYGNAHEGYADDPEQDHARVMNALGGFLAAIHTLRQWSGQWLLTLDQTQWDRKVLHPQKGPLSVRRMVAMTTWHLEHHARFMTQKLDKMVGPAPVEAPKPAGGGCGSGCGCAR